MDFSIFLFHLFAPITRHIVSPEMWFINEQEKNKHIEKNNELIRTETNSGSVSSYELVVNFCSYQAQRLVLSNFCVKMRRLLSTMQPISIKIPRRRSPLLAPSCRCDSRIRKGLIMRAGSFGLMK